MAAMAEEPAARDLSSSLTKSARITKFDPTKEDDFRAWYLAIRAGASTALSTAIQYGVPTWEQATQLSPENADYDTITDTYGSLCQSYMYCQEEAWRAIILLTSFNASPAAQALLETIDRKFGKGKQGIDALTFMINRFDSKRSFAKQQDLIARLAPDQLRARRPYCGGAMNSKRLEGWTKAAIIAADKVENIHNLAQPWRSLTCQPMVVVCELMWLCGSWCVCGPSAANPRCASSESASVSPI